MSKINLNNGWQFLEQWEDRYSIYPIEGETVTVPHTTKVIPLNGFDEEQYMLHCCYQRTVEIDKNDVGKNFTIHFEAVAHNATVYCNGQEVTNHLGGYTAFDADITRFVRIGENLITVEVDASENTDIPPFSGVIDYLCFGGIYREVQLLIRPADYIKSVHVDGNHLGKTNIQVFRSCEEPINAVISLHDNKGNNIYKLGIEVGLSTGVEIDIDGITPWSIENPMLYTLTVELANGDSYSARFGYRTCKFTSEGFFLNGKHVKLLGLNRHQSYPYVGYAMPSLLQEIDAEKVKSSGCNIVRHSHYPQSHYFTDRCDEIGLLCFVEAPGWQSIGGDEFKANYCQAVSEMINENYNHPSIVVWGVRVNEGPDCDELYTYTNDLAHSIDKTRQTSGVRDFKHSHLLEDVYAYNDFRHSGKNAGTANKFSVCGNAPLLITEHNGHMFPTKPFDHVERRVEHTLRHARVIDSAFGSNGTSGVIGWCFSDYNTHVQFGSGDRICYHGVHDMFRNPKVAQGLYASQQNQYPVLDIISSDNLGDYSGMRRENIVVASNCDYINVYNNDRLVDTFYPSTDYKNMPHPPYIIEHLLNGEVERLFPQYDQKQGKEILKALVAGAKGMQANNVFSILGIMLKYRKGTSYWVEMGKQVIMRNGQVDNFKFVGFINDKPVIERKFGKSKQCTMTATTLTPVVPLGSTYQIAQIDVRVADSNDITAVYSDDVVAVSCEGGSVVGASTGSLIGGMRSFYVKVTETGRCTVNVSTNNYGSARVVLEVVK